MIENLQHQINTEPCTLYVKGKAHFDLTDDIITCRDNKQNVINFLFQETEKNAWIIIPEEDFNSRGQEDQLIYRTKALIMKTTKWTTVHCFSSSVFTVNQNAELLKWINTNGESKFEVIICDVHLNDSLIFFCNGSSKVIYLGCVSQIHVHGFSDCKFYMSSTIKRCTIVVCDNADIDIQTVTNYCEVHASNKAILELTLSSDCVFQENKSKKVKTNIKHST